MWVEFILMPKSAMLYQMLEKTSKDVMFMIFLSLQCRLKLSLKIMSFLYQLLLA